MNRGNLFNAKPHCLRHKKAFTMVELAIVVAIFVIVAAALTPFIHIIKDWANVMGCAHNLRQISLGLHAYTVDRKGILPTNLTDLYPIYVKDKKYFYCPAVKNHNGEPNYDYDYIKVSSLASSGNPVVVEDRGSNHGSSGKHVVRANGSLQWENIKKM